jgi:hypothetical protein
MTPIAGVRCMITPVGSGAAERGFFVGLMYEHRSDDEGVAAVVRLDGHGMFVTAVHPSRVTLLTEDTCTSS